MRCRPWSDFELALLDGLYGLGNPWRAELRRALGRAGRKPGAIRQTAHLRGLAHDGTALDTFKLLVDRGMSVARASAISGVPLRAAFMHDVALRRRNATQWTARKDALLREHWGMVTPVRLDGMFPEHTWEAILMRASRLRLGASHPPGWLPERAISEQNHLTGATTRRILAAARVPCRHPYRHDRPAISKQRYYPPMLARRALAAYFRGETVSAAAERHGTSYVTMQRAAVAFGLIKSGPIPRPTRLDPHRVNAAIAAYWAARPMSVRRRVRHPARRSAA